MYSVEDEDEDKDEESKVGIGWTYCVLIGLHT
jgi:hypothetical protein